MVVVQLATTSNLLFGGTANFLVAREFSDLATYDQKLALMRCLFALSATDEAISTAEEGEVHRIAKELRVTIPILSRYGSRTSGTSLACRASPVAPHVTAWTHESRAKADEKSQLTGISFGGTVPDMGSLRQFLGPREVAPDVCPPAPRWLPRAFRNLGRGVF